MKKIKLPKEKELQGFIEKLCAGAGVSLKETGLKLDIEIFKKDHDPKNFSALKGRCCCYMFFFHTSADSGYFLKIGQCSKTNNPRYKVHHYEVYGKIKSSLANSLHNSDEYKKNYPQLKNDKKIGDWIKENCTRINILFNQDQALKISNSKENFILNLIEAGLQLKYTPEFEGTN